MTTNYTPVVQTYNATVNGFQLVRTANATITVSSGQCFDSTNSNFIDTSTLSSATTTVSTAFVGLNGLDVGTVAASTMYAVFVVSDPSGFNRPGYLLSTSGTAPVLPAGLYNTNYSQFRRIGWIKTGGSSNILKFYQSTALGNVRTMQYDAPIAVLTAGVATAYTAVDLSTAVPALSSTAIFGKIYITSAFTPNAASDTASLRPTGATADLITMTGQVAAVIARNEWTMLPLVASSKAEIDYKVSVGTAALTLNVIGYDDVL